MCDGSRFPKETGVDQTRRHCSAETILDTGPGKPGWSWSMSKNAIDSDQSRRIGAGCQTDENRYYTLILARRPRSVIQPLKSAPFYTPLSRHISLVFHQILLHYDFASSSLFESRMTHTLSKKYATLTYRIMKYVALAERCCHHRIRFRHHNMHVIRWFFSRSLVIVSFYWYAKRKTTMGQLAKQRRKMRSLVLEKSNFHVHVIRDNQ